MSDAGGPSGDDPAPAGRDQAIARLGDAARALTEAVVRTEVADGELLRAADDLERVAARLSASVRGVHHVPLTERFEGLIRVFSPVDGPGHPDSFPVAWEQPGDGSIRGTAPLGARFEGPPGLLHGGVIAELFDQALGVAVAMTGVRALTASLSVQYLRPLPLDAGVVLTARVDRTAGRKHWAVGEMTSASTPELVAARAEALFVVPSTTRAEDHFAALRRSDGTPVEFDAPVRPLPVAPD